MTKGFAGVGAKVFMRAFLFVMVSEESLSCRVEVKFIQMM